MDRKIISPSITAIILAAGKSSRMGEPKPLVQFGAKTFLETVIGNFRESGISNILVVLGHEADRILEITDLPPQSYAINKNYHLGQFSSVRVGIRNLSPGCTGAFLALVDQPQIGADTLISIWREFEKHPDKILIPTYKGKRAHPPLLPNWLFPKILAADESRKTSEIIRVHSQKSHEIEIADEKILWNLNTPQDVKTALEEKAD